MTRDDIIRMAIEADRNANTNAQYSLSPETLRWLERFAALVVAAEREECAKLCDDLVNPENSEDYAAAAGWCAERIRARGQA